NTIRCYPDCRQSAKSRVPTKVEVPPKPFVFNNLYDTARYCLCHRPIAVGDEMKADRHDVEDGQRRWFNTQHHPSCPPAPVGLSSSRRSGASAIDSALSGGG
ncbi:unnamed protein product, partial [Ectocarpus sp. 12 AP-2014]